jgi:multicomponent Na+:H+ antiporter subunit A
MNLSEYQLVLLAVLPLLAGIALQIALACLLSSRAKGVLALASSILAFAAVVAAYAHVMRSGPFDCVLPLLSGPFQLAFHVDVLSTMFAAMGAGLGSIVLLYSIDYMAKDPAATRFYAFMLLFIAGMVGLVYSANIFAVYFCWELMGLCSFSLVGFWYTQSPAVAGARKVLLMTHVAGYGLLAAILLLYTRTGSALWTDPAIAHAFTTGVYTLMLVALLAKSVQFPLHTWIPEAMNAPTPVSALLHAACYVKAGVYLAARMHSMTPWPQSWSLVLMWLGTVTMVVGVAYAMVQHDLKRMLAFHTVSQIGYIITGFGLGTPLGIAAGLLHCLNHSLFKGGLFLAAGAVQHATGTRDMNRLGGLSRSMPRTAVAWMIGVGAMMGVPFMSGFASKWMLYTAALQAGQVVPALVAWVVSVGTVFSCVKATSTVFLGPTTPDTESAHEAPATMVTALMIFACGSIVLGVAPQLAVNGIINPALPALGFAPVQVSWFGLTPSAGSWWTTGGLILAAVSAGMGVIFYLFAGISRARGMAMPGQVVLGGAGYGGSLGVFTGGEAIEGGGRLPASEFSALVKQHLKPLYLATDVDRVYRGLLQVARSISRGVNRAIAWMDTAPLTWILLLTAVVFVAVRCFAPVASQQTFLNAETVPMLLDIGCMAAGAALLLVTLSDARHRQLFPLMALGVAFSAAALWTASPVPRLILLEMGSFAILFLVAQTASRTARWVFTSVVLVSAACMITGQICLAHGLLDTARSFLMAGFVLKLGFAPLLFWMPLVIESVPVLVAGSVLAVVDIAAFGEFLLLTQAHPMLLEPRGCWIAIAVITALVGAIAMLAAGNVKRMLCFSTIEDMGFLLLGAVVAGNLGLKGAWIAAAVHAMAKALLFISLAAPEADGVLDGDPRGLAARYPVSAAAFMAGMLAMLGVPPLMGFEGRWRLYLAALSIHPLLLAVFVISSICALLAYVFRLTSLWWGPASLEANRQTTREPWLLRAVMIGLIVLLLTGGVWPNLFLAFAGGIQ